MAIYTKEEQLKLIRDNIDNLKFIDNQCEEVCLEAVKKDGYAIQYITNPTNKMKLEAVKNNGYVIRCIENPTDEIKLEAVKKNGRAIQYVENPTKEMKIEAAKNNMWAIQYMDRIDNEICLNSILNKSKDFENINIDYEKFMLNNATFLIGSDELDIRLRFNGKYFKKWDTYKKDKLVEIPLIIFEKLKGYLINLNVGNSFILHDDIDIKTLKEIAITDNEIIYITCDEDKKISSLYSSLVNKIINVDDFMSK